MSTCTTTKESESLASAPPGFVSDTPPVISFNGADGDSQFNRLFANLDADARKEGCVKEPNDDGMSFLELAERDIDYSQKLLGERWLCRGGAGLLVAASGVGKSTWIQQTIASWACGNAAFEIIPSVALRVTVIQAENDCDDLTEISRGVLAGLDLSDEKLGLVHRHTRFIRRFETGKDFLSMLDKELTDHPVDLVVIDPLNAYAGGDVKDARLIAEFCRAGLNLLLFKHKCGLLLIHHTPKTNYRDTSSYSLLDYSYAGAGGADLTNWARAVISIEPVSIEDGMFRLIASKRGKRIGWRDDEGSPVYERYIRHSREHGVIRWEDASQDDIAAVRRTDAKGKTVPEPADVLAYVEDGQLIGKADLVHQVQRGLEIGQNKAGNFVKVLIERNELHEHRLKRSSKRDEIKIARFPQKEGHAS